MALTPQDVKRLNQSAPVANDLKIGDLLKTLEDATGGEITVTWSDVSGKPSEFTPKSHTHTIAQVNTLQTELDGIKSRLDALEAGGGA